ncbi:hypothetical protein QFZ70_003538 [Arthrobacter sp. V1I9]|jgi:hypothetical protein|nr:hypothetical protein [Arthrobacter sp. V1I9]
MTEIAEDELDLAENGSCGATVVAAIRASARPSDPDSRSKQLSVRRQDRKAAVSCHFRGRNCRRPQ